MANIRHINEFDIVNGFWGTSVSVWFQGCEHRCIECFNPETWNPNDKSVENKSNKIVSAEILNKIDKYFTKNLSFLGGDPFASYNVIDLYEIINIIKNQKPSIKIAVWTGYTWEKLIKNDIALEILKNVDIIVDGKYEKDLKCNYNISKIFNDKKRGSSNQRIINVEESLKQNKVILWENKE